MFRPNNQIVRYLSADEYQRLIDAAENIRWYLRPVIELAANTGLRCSNILALRWDECDRKAGVIRKAKTKNNEAVAIPMNAAVSGSSINSSNDGTVHHTDERDLFAAHVDGSWGDEGH